MEYTSILIIYLKRDSNCMVLQCFHPCAQQLRYTMIEFINFETLNRWLEISRERYPRNDKSLLWLCFEFRASTFVPRLPRSKDEKTKMEGTSILVSLPPLVSLPSHCTIPCLPPVVIDARVCRSQNLGRAQCSSFMRGILARGGRYLRLEEDRSYTQMEKWKRNFLVRYISYL